MALTDEFLYERLRELTREHVATPPKDLHLWFGEPEDTGYHEFELEVLEQGQDEHGPYWQVLSSLICMRKKGVLGSPYHPLCCISIVRPSGQVRHGVIGNSAVDSSWVAF